MTVTMSTDSNSETTAEREWCAANNIGWCDIHNCEYTYSPWGDACAPCGWAAIEIDRLVEEAGLDWEEARAQYDAGLRACEFCGYCDGKCAWRIVCPTCGAPPGVAKGQCREGGRLVKLHEERWAAVA